MRVRTMAALAAATAVLAAAALGATPQPRLVSATAVGDRVNLTFSAAVAPRPGGTLSVSVNGEAVRATRAVVSGRRLQLVLPRPVYGDDVVQIAGRNLRTRDRRLIRRFSQAAVNRSTPGCTLDTEGPLDPAALGARRYSILSVSADFGDSAPPGRVLQPLSPLRLNGIDTWLRELSYGRASVDGVDRSVAVRMPKAFGDYAFAGGWGARKPLFQDLVLALDGEVDFSGYDAVFVNVRPRTGGPPVPFESVAIAPVGAGVVADGKELRHFGAFAAGRPDEGLATLLQLAGLRRGSPDQVAMWRGPLYQARLKPLGMLGWDRRKLGWLDPTQVRCLRSEPLEVTLAPLALSGGVKMVVTPLAGNALLVLENRQRVGLDADHCKAGILAYEVQPDTPYRLRVLPVDARASAGCTTLAHAPHNLPPPAVGSAAGVSFQALAVLEGGAHRLRVRR